MKIMIEPLHINTIFVKRSVGLDLCVEYKLESVFPKEQKNKEVVNGKMVITATFRKFEKEVKIYNINDCGVSQLKMIEKLQNREYAISVAEHIIEQSKKSKHNQFKNM